MRNEIMNTDSILAPLFKKIDKIFFGFEEVDDLDTNKEVDSDIDDEFDAERSTN